MFNSLIPSPNYPLSGMDASKAFDFMASQDAGLVNDHFSISGFIFDYAGEVSTELGADITDQYVEDNTVIQDHIALKPVRVVMKGLIGELRAGPAIGGLSGVLNGLQSSFATVNAYIGGKTPSALVKASKAISQAQNISNQISSAVSKGESLYSFLKDGAQSNSRQAGAYKYLRGLTVNRVPFTIQTPHQIYKNMVIESLRALQPEDTKFLSEFVVTLKELRFASLTTTVTAKNANSKVGQAKENLKKKSPAAGKVKATFDPVTHKPTITGPKQ